MAAEDLTTFTEVDPGTYLSVTSSRATFTNYNQNIDAYVYDDKGAAYFDGDFEHLVTVYQGPPESTGQPYVEHWCLANVVNDFYYIYLSHDFLGVDVRSTLGTPDYIRFNLREGVAGTRYSTGWDGSINTPYYLKIKRDEGVGDYGTLYCYIYSDAARTNLLATLSLALHEKEDFRYIFVAQSWNTGSVTPICDGYIENLDLQEVVEKSASDSGAGAEAVALAVTLSKLDSGAGAEAVDLAVTLALRSDSGSGVDVAAVLGLYSAQDSGVGLDLGEVLVPLVGSDSGVGLDSFKLLVRPPVRTLAAVRNLPAVREQEKER